MIAGVNRCSSLRFAIAIGRLATVTATYGVVFLTELNNVDEQVYEELEIVNES